MNTLIRSLFLITSLASFSLVAMNNNNNNDLSSKKHKKKKKKKSSIIIIESNNNGGDVASGDHFAGVEQNKGVYVEHGAANKVLFDAIKQNDLGSVSNFIEKASVFYEQNSFNRMLSYILAQAVIENNIAIASFIISKNQKIIDDVLFRDLVNSKFKGHNALTIAIMFENVEMVRMLAENGASVNKCNVWQKMSPLALAQDLGNHEIVDFLAQKGALE